MNNPELKYCHKEHSLNGKKIIKNCGLVLDNSATESASYICWINCLQGIVFTRSKWDEIKSRGMNAKYHKTVPGCERYKTGSSLSRQTSTKSPVQTPCTSLYQAPQRSGAAWSESGTSMSH